MKNPDLAPLNDRKGRRELVLNLWVLDISATKIAAIAGLASKGSVTTIVMNARRMGDPRAIWRGHGYQCRARALAVASVGREGDHEA